MGLAGLLAEAMGGMETRKQAARQMMAVLDSHHRKQRGPAPPRKATTILPMTPPALEGSRRAGGLAPDETKADVAEVACSTSRTWDRRGSELQCPGVHVRGR